MGGHEADATSLPTSAKAYDPNHPTNKKKSDNCLLPQR